MRRKIKASPEMIKAAQRMPSKMIEVYSFYPCDKWDCPCQKEKVSWMQEMSQMSESRREAAVGAKGFIACPRSKEGMNRYSIICKVCGDLQGYCWATDAKLTDWCDFHYVQWVYKGYWHGCLTHHISPISQKLCLECCCGADTRDFRANMALPVKEVKARESKNEIGRDFGTKYSTFSVRKVRSDVLPFKKG